MSVIIAVAVIYDTMGIYFYSVTAIIATTSTRLFRLILRTGCQVTPRSACRTPEYSINKDKKTYFCTPIYPYPYNRVISSKNNTRRGYMVMRGWLKHDDSKSKTERRPNGWQAAPQSPLCNLSQITARLPVKES